MHEHIDTAIDGTSFVGTISGFVCSIFFSVWQLGVDELSFVFFMKTAIAAIIGATLGFFTTMFLKWLVYLIKNFPR